jgi:excisionase family DNA binding protein
MTFGVPKYGRIALQFTSRAIIQKSNLGAPLVPQTKKPRNSRNPRSTVATNGVQSFGEVLSLAEAAAFLKVSTADVLRMVDEQDLPGRQIGSEWRFLKAAIRVWLSRDLASATSKAAQLGVAGSWKDDPMVDQELREILARRRYSGAEESP